MRRLLRFIKLPGQMKLLCVEAYLLLSFSALILRIFRFSAIAGVLGYANRETSHSDHGIDPYLVKQISLAIQLMQRYTFRESTCLIQAYTAKMMLRKRKLKSTVYLGVAKMADTKMTAHAWVRCGTIFVTGGDASQVFTITGKFAD